MRAICIQTDAQRPEAQTPNTLGLPGSGWQPQYEPCDGRARSGLLAPGWQDHEERIVLAFIQATKQRQPVPWDQLRQHLPGRSFDSVRQRWALLRKQGQLERTKEGREQLDELSSTIRVEPDLGKYSRSRRAAFTAAEDTHIMRQHALLGGKWRQIARGLPGCSESSVRHRYQHLLKKRGRQEVEQDAETPHNPAPSLGVSRSVLALPLVTASDAPTALAKSVIFLSTKHRV